MQVCTQTHAITSEQLLDHLLGDLVASVALQKMQMISDKLWANMSYFPNELSAEVRERESFKEQLQAKVGLDEILGGELQRRSTLVETRNIRLQVLLGRRSPKWL